MLNDLGLSPLQFPHWEKDGYTSWTYVTARLNQNGFTWLLSECVIQHSCGRRLHRLSIDLENNDLVLLCQVLQVYFFLHIFANLGDSSLDSCIFDSAGCWIAAAFQSARCQFSVSSVHDRGAQSVGERCLSTATKQPSSWSSQSITHSRCWPMLLENISIFMQIYVDFLCYILRLITFECTHGGSLVQPPLADCFLWVFCKTWQQWEGLLRPDRVCSIPNSPSMCSWLTSGSPNRLWQEELIYMMSKHIEMHSNTQSLHSVDWLDSYLLQHDVIHVQEVSALNYRCNLPRYKLNILKERQYHRQQYQHEEGKYFYAQNICKFCVVSFDV